MKFINKAKSVVYVLAAAAVVALSSSSWAAYSSKSRSTFTASADLSALTGDVRLSVRFFNGSTDAEVTSGDRITWAVGSGNDSLLARGVVWSTASNYARVESTITTRGGVIQLFTDNEQVLGNAGVSLTPYNRVLSTTQFGVDISTVGLYPFYHVTATSGTCLPFAWRVSPDKLTGNTTNLMPVYDTPDHISIVGQANIGTGNAYHPWRYISDYRQFSTSNAGADLGGYSELRRAGLGLAVQEGGYGTDTDSTSYVYFAADFSNALDQTKYQANVIVEAFKE